MQLFTPEEANVALPVVRLAVERLVAARRRLSELDQRLAPVRARVAGNGGGLHPGPVGALQEEAAASANRLREAFEELDGLGVQVKDPDTGLVDFPARHPADGSTVLLCWRLGEPEVSFWHTLEAGFAGRKPLPF
ncbi:MAG TPA: DUF2203 domain-containing protein [Gaiellaceae bacterium]|nr:DUF2203 domain-containing protein [Gaiellaceae bacterium]